MTTIKITELSSIGANLATSTVLPVVNMSGTPTTEKTTLGNIANIVLAGAGGNYTAAAVAILAQKVTNAAQPNITSVGTLTSLVVSGNASVNGNVTSNGTAYVGNLSTTGLASITTLTVGATANLGAVGNVTITGGTVGQVLTTNGSNVLSWTTVSGGSYGNSNVANYLPTFTGNIGGNVVTANLFVGSGANLTNIAGANVSGAVGLATYATTANAVAGANVSGFVPNANVANTAFAVAAANVSGLGNIATINLDGNSSNVLRGDGTFAADANSSYGNSNVVLLMTAFGSNTITTTGNVSVGNILGNGQALTGIAGANVSGFVPNANVANTAIAIAGANVSGFVPNANVANTAFAVAAANVSGLGNIATINLTGSTSNVLYGNGVFAAIAGGANTANVTFSNVTVQGVNQLNLSAGADFTANLAYLQVRSGDVASHIHLDTGNNNAYDLIVGDDAKFVQVSSTGNIIMSSYDSANTTSYVWTFNKNGNLTLPGNLVIAGNTSVFGTNASLLQTTDNRPLLSVSSGSNGGVSSLWVEDIGNVGTSNIAAVYTNPTSGSGIVRIAVGQNGSPGPNLWDFNANGTLTLPSGGNISTTGAVTANTANITTGNITTINSGLLQNGNSNITITSNGNVSIQSAGSNVELVVTSTGANITGTLTSTGKIGYASGSTVTQTSNRGNGVNINALAGTIVTVSASMTAGEIGAFSVTNNQVDTNNDIVLVQVVSPNLGNYNVIANPNSGIGGFYLTLQNISGFPISAEAVTIRFMVIKAPNA
jgi:hypothetical protein